MEALESLKPLQSFAEVLTVLISTLGILICLKHMRFFTDNLETSRKLNRVFKTDAIIYLVTLIMGLSLYFDLYLVTQIDIIIRPLALILNVAASYHLFKHFKEMK